MDAIFQTIWEISLFSIGVILLLALFSKFLGKRYGVGWRYLLWMVVAVRLIIPVQLSPPQALMGFRLTLPSIQNEMTELQEKRTATPEEGIVAPFLDQVDLKMPMAQAEGDIPVEGEEQKSLADFFLTYPDLLWLLGAILFLAWQAWKYRAFRRLLKRNSRKISDAEILDCYYGLCEKRKMKKRPELFFCSVLSGPLCTGFFRQEIYLNSEDREIGEISLILRHELTHCQRRDIWGKGLLLLARGLHFFNPFVHWMARLAEKDMEFSCDMQVMQDCTTEERQAYSMAILKTIQEGKRGNMSLSTAFFGGKRELKARFENIFDGTTKKRGIALFSVAGLLISFGTAFVGCVAPPPQGEPKSSMVYGAYTEETIHALYEAKLDYIGNHVGVGKIYGLLPMPEGVTPHEEGMELFTTEEPYGVRFHVNWEPTAETAYTFEKESYADDRWFYIHAMIFLSLVDNGAYFEYEEHHDGKEGYVIVTKAFDREMAERYFGKKDLREFAAEEETFRAFVVALNRYFYEGIQGPQSIQELLHMSEAEARARMELILSGQPLEAARTEESGEMFMTQQEMLLRASLLLEEVAGQKLTSSDPQDYIECQEYEDLVKLGEPAARYLLSGFAMGNLQNDLRGQIAMLACQDILGEPRQRDLTPMEWYGAYSASDSFYAAPFVYDPQLYRADMEKKYGLGSPAAERDSILRAEKDEKRRAVYDALAERMNGVRTGGHTVAFFAPQIYHMEEGENTFSAFAMVSSREFALSRTKNGGYALYEQGGADIPSRLDFEKRSGKWILTKWTQARDGSDYAPSIEEMCRDVKSPADLAKRLIGNEMGDKNILLWQNIIYYMKAHEVDYPIYFNSFMEEELTEQINGYIKAIPMYESKAT